MRAEQRLDRLAARRLGLFTRSDATACGFSDYQIRRRIRAGEWEPVSGRVLTRRGRPRTPKLEAAAAHLAVPGSVVAGPSAALWYELPVPADAGRWLWLGRSARCRVGGIRVISDPLGPGDVLRGDGVLVTGPARTTFDCLRALTDAQALRVADHALQRGWCGIDDLRSRLLLFTGRNGAPRLVRLIGSLGDGTRSASERLAVQLLRAANITGWEANAEIRDSAGLIGYGDLVFRAVRVVVELDGWAFHSDHDRFQRDRTRQNRLVAAGWTVLRFTWADLHHRPEYVVRAVRAALHRSNPHDR